MSSLKKSVLILGASSDISRSTALSYASLGWDLILAAREPRLIEDEAGNIAIRYGVRVESLYLDILDIASHNKFLDNLKTLPDTVLCAVGLLGNQEKDETDPLQAEIVLRTNFNAPAIFLGEIANRMVLRGSGTIIGISSVAGERGRAKNYIYGSAKAGFSAFLSGLRCRLTRNGVRVITIKPGFVRTKMINGLKTPNLLTAEPNEVAQAIIAAQAGNKEVIYIRPIWRLIMIMIKMLPERLFKLMNL